MFLFNIFKRKPKLTKEEVTKTILELENHLDHTEDKLDSLIEERKNLFQKGKATTDQHRRLYIGKKIGFIDQEMTSKTEQAMLIMYNIQLAKKFEIAIENENFIQSVGAVGFNKLLGDQKALAKFLNTALNRRVDHETMLTEADDLYTQVKEQYSKPDRIYGISEEDDKILAMFEQEDISDIETEKANVDEKKADDTNMKGM